MFGDGEAWNFFCFITSETAFPTATTDDMDDRSIHFIWIQLMVLLPWRHNVDLPLRVSVQKILSQTDSSSRSAASRLGDYNPSSSMPSRQRPLQPLETRPRSRLRLRKCPLSPPQWTRTYWTTLARPMKLSRLSHSWCANSTYSQVLDRAKPVDRSSYHRREGGGQPEAN